MSTSAISAPPAERAPLSYEVYLDTASRALQLLGDSPQANVVDQERTMFRIGRPGFNGFPEDQISTGHDVGIQLSSDLIVGGELVYSGTTLYFRHDRLNPERNTLMVEVLADVPKYSHNVDILDIAKTVLEKLQSPSVTAQPISSTRKTY